MHGWRRAGPAAPLKSVDVGKAAIDVRETLLAHQAEEDRFRTQGALDGPVHTGIVGIRAVVADEENVAGTDGARGNDRRRAIQTAGAAAHVKNAADGFELTV